MMAPQMPAISPRPAPGRMAPARPPMRAAQALAPAPMSMQASRPMMHAATRTVASSRNMPRGGHRGLGDGVPQIDPRILSAMRSGGSGTPTATAAVQQSGSLELIRQTMAQRASSLVQATAGTLDPCNDPETGTPIPCEQLTDASRALCAACNGGAATSLPSLSIEGALPAGVAFVLAGAVGLTLVSMMVSK